MPRLLPWRRALTGALLVLSTLTAQAQKGQRLFNHEPTGISLTRPTGWHILIPEIGQADDSPEKVVIVNDPVLKRQFTLGDGNPLVALLADTLTAPRLYPLVRISVIPDEDSDPDAAKVLEAIRQSYTTDKDFKSLSAVGTETVDGKPGATLRALLTIRDDETGKSTDYPWLMLVVRRHRDLVLINYLGPATVSLDAAAQQLKAALVGLRIKPDQPVVRDLARQEFKDAVTGLQLVKPAGWYTQAADPNDADDKHLLITFRSDTLLKLDVRPVVRVMGYPSTGQMRQTSPESLLREIVPGVQRSMDHRLETVRDVEATTLGGQPAARVRFQYAQETNKGEQEMVLQMYLVKADVHVFTLTLLSPQAAEAALDRTFANVLASVRLRVLADAAGAASPTYTDKDLGLTITRPAGWLFVRQEGAAPPPAKGKRRKKSQGESYREIVRMIEHDLPEGQTRPRAVLVARFDDALPNKTLPEFLALALPELLKRMNGCSPIDDVRSSTLANQPAATVRVRCSSVGDNALPMTIALWVVRHRGQCLMFNLVDAGENPDTGAPAFQSILQSLQLQDK